MGVVLGLVELGAPVELDEPFEHEARTGIITTNATAEITDLRSAFTSAPPPMNLQESSPDEARRKAGSSASTMDHPTPSH